MKWSIAPFVALGLLAGPAPQTALAQDAEAAAVAAAPAAPGGLLGLFAAFDAKCHACKLQCCHTPFGKLITGAVTPMSMMTGGLIPTPCANANAGAAGPAGTASKIQADAAAAKARAEAVRYLGTVDCHYYPEAEASLIAALRADRSECVRLAAAQALGSGCCCTKRTIEALTLAVNGSDVDGNPGERSMRVKVAAYMALQNCLGPYSGVSPLPPVQPIRPEMPPPSEAATSQDAASSSEGVVQLAGYYEQNKPMADVLWAARQTLAQVGPTLPVQAEPQPRVRRNLFDLWKSTREPDEPTPAAPTPVADFSQ